jgi:transposase-like protein
VGEVSYKGHRYPAEIIAHCVWLYHRLPLSFREVEEPMRVRGVIVTYETIRQWCAKFGPVFAAGLRRRQPRPGDKWHLDEVFLTINGRRQYLWRAVDQDGNVLDILIGKPHSCRTTSSTSPSCPTHTAWVSVASAPIAASASRCCAENSASPTAGPPAMRASRVVHRPSASAAGPHLRWHCQVGEPIMTRYGSSANVRRSGASRFQR